MRKRRFNPSNVISATVLRDEEQNLTLCTIYEARGVDLFSSFAF